VYKDVTVAQVDDFDEVIDVRSPGEYAHDHIPGSLNCPVLDDEERARVGTLHNQVSPFEARRVGAALVARNIARHLENVLKDRPRQWRPLIYCWRGGGRSDAMAEVLRRVGWRAGKLEGGYRTYRRSVIEELETLPGRFRFVVLCGRTGSGKSAILRALAALGEQVLDLEHLARHRGSVLGELPGAAQPSQKFFESLLRHALLGFDATRPVYVEAESRKVGNLQVPPALIAAIRVSECIVIEADIAVRSRLLLDEYGHFLANADGLIDRLRALTMHYGKAKIEQWVGMCVEGRYAELVESLLHEHYDPAYDRSIQRNFPAVSEAPRLALLEAGDDSMRALAAAARATIAAHALTRDTTAAP
jgi:tRNA 2-selenouridine synthase